MGLNKPNTIFRVCFAAAFSLQIACANSGAPGTGNSSPKKDESAIEKVWKELTTANFPSPNEADFEQEKAEAKKLVASGIKFTVTMASHGMTKERGVTFGRNEIESSDGVKIIRYAKLYDTPEQVKAAFDESSQTASKIFEKSTLNSKLAGQTIERFIGVSGGEAVIVYTSGYYLYRVSSSSLRHLLAIEQVENHFFDYNLP